MASARSQTQVLNVLQLLSRACSASDVAAHLQAVETVVSPLLEPEAAEQLAACAGVTALVTAACTAAATVLRILAAQRCTPTSASGRGGGSLVSTLVCSGLVSLVAVELLDRLPTQQPPAALVEAAAKGEHQCVVGGAPGCGAVSPPVFQPLPTAFACTSGRVAGLGCELAGAGCAHTPCLALPLQA